MAQPHRLWRRPARGQGLTEYALLIALLALAVVGGLTLVGDQLVSYYTNEISAVLDSV